MTDVDAQQNKTWALPHINTAKLPQAEQKSVEHLNASFGDLLRYANDFGAALNLFISCKSTIKDNSNAAQWIFVAGRDGAMSIYHFGRALEGMMAFIGQCPSVLAAVDRAKLRSTRKLLRELFPDFEAVRHAVAHAGELMKDPDTSDRHSISLAASFVKKLVVRDNFEGTQYQNTFEGKLQSYSLHSSTFESLLAIAREFYSAFTDIDQKILAKSSAST